MTILIFYLPTFPKATSSGNSLSILKTADVNAGLEGKFNGSLAITAPVNIGVVDVTVQLTSTESASTGFVLDSTTFHFSENPPVNASITGSTDGITPTFTIQSQPFVEVIAAQSYIQPISITRAFTIEGEVLNNGSILSGTYIETIAGYTHKPLQISGDILLSKSQLSRVGSVTLAIPQETLAEGESMEITVTVLDQDGQPLAGELVTFFGGLGTLNPDNGVTNAQGQVTVRYTAGPSSGQAQLQALVGSANGSASVQINSSAVTPEPTTPTPVAPGPIEPTPVTPEPTKPTSVTPGPIDPTPVTPEPTTPTPVTPGPIEPTPVTPEPTPVTSESPEPTPGGTESEAPTVVNLSSFTVALRNDTELVIRWTTSIEIDTAGFHILRSSDNTLASARQVTGQRVPSQGSNGGDYEIVLPYDLVTDPPLSTASFWLYEIETDGTINYYGPATIDVDASQLNQLIFLPFLSQ